MEELKALLKTHFNNEEFLVEEDKILDREIRWRPPIYASKNEEELIVDVRLNNSIPNFWLDTYKSTYQKFPNSKIFIAIPKDIVIPYVLGKKLEENNVGIISVDTEEITYPLEPGSYDERETSKVIRKKLDARINKSFYEDLGSYIKGIQTAINIYEIGHPREAIGVIGRELEQAIDDFLIDANKKHKISISERRRKGMSFDDKINFLHSTNNRGRGKPRNIQASEKTKMLSVKWDRNIGDHPAEEEEIEQMVRDSRAILELGINMIRLMKTKRETL